MDSDRPTITGKDCEQIAQETNTPLSISPAVETDDDESNASVLVHDQKRRDYNGGRKPVLTRKCSLCCYSICLWIFEIALVLSIRRIGVGIIRHLEPTLPFPVSINASIESIAQFTGEVLDGLLPYIDELGEEISKVLPSANISLGSFAYYSTNKQSAGYRLAKEGAHVVYPVVIVPGFVTSGLEVWSGKECTRGFFRQRIWGALSAAKSFVLERECWKTHMMMNPVNGEDPEGIHVRAASGFGAADYFIANYWVFAKLIENLAEVGYTTSTMAMETYDWRLAFPMLEQRDGYFTQLKHRIEGMHKSAGNKVVLASHSMGALVIHHFFGWVTAPEKQGGGGGGKKWVDKHIHAYINVAGVHLGVPKAATALLSGEMSDVVVGGRMEQLMEQFFGRRLRRDLWSSWGSLWAMLPKGGDALWGPGHDMCFDTSVNDPFCHKSNNDSILRPMIAMTDSTDDISAKLADTVSETRTNLNVTLSTFLSRSNHTVESLISFLNQYGSGLGPDHVGTRFMSQYGDETVKSRQWFDPARQALPYAPNMKIFCLYGVGIRTERAYYYKRHRVEPITAHDYEKMADPAVVIDSQVTMMDKNVSFGIKYVDGDGSVPLISLGYLCNDAWHRSDSGLNPSEILVFTREYKHKPEFQVDDPMRSGRSSADHVDILGNDLMQADFIKIVTAWRREEVESDNIESDIKNIAEMTNSHPKGGIFKNRRDRMPRFSSLNFLQALKQ